MGINIDEIEYFHTNGYLGARVLDLGAQVLHHASADVIARIACWPIDQIRLSAMLDKAAPFVAELYALLGIDYLSYDVCSGPGAVAFDLNTDSVPTKHRGAFDLVTNCGTGEHVMNQMNFFAVMHDAVRVGGAMFHQMPASGYVDHGYFCYQAQFFRDLAAANNYNLADLWYVYRGDMRLDPTAIDIRDSRKPSQKTSGQELPHVPSYNIVAVLIKQKIAPFQMPLELRTAAAGTHINLRAAMAYPEHRRKFLLGRAVMARDWLPEWLRPLLRRRQQGARP